MANSTYAATPTPLRRGIPEIPVRLVHAGILLAALGIGAVAAFRPALAVTAMVGLALIPIVLTRPIVGFCALVFLSFLEEYSAMTGAVSVIKILGALLILAWLAIVATTGSRERGGQGLLSREPALAAALVIFAAWASMSLVWAEVPEAAQSAVLRFVLNFLLFPIALVAIRAPRHVVWMLAAFLAGSFAAVAVGFLTGAMETGEEERLRGAGLNPNQLGTYLVVSMIFAATFAANRRWSSFARVLALVVAGLAGVAFLMTLSRGALVGLAAALLVAPLAMGRGRRLGTLVLVVATVVGTLCWYTAIAPANAVERVTHPERGGGSGREDLWRVGLRIVEDRPLHGVGAGNFPESSIHYLLRPGLTERDEIIVDEKKVAHNIYLTVLSELGAVGLSLFLVILALCLRCALQAAQRFTRQGNVLMELTSRGLFISLVSLLVADFFSSALYSKQLWVLLAAAPALLALSERSDSPLPAKITRRGQRRNAPTPAVG